MDHVDSEDRVDRLAKLIAEMHVKQQSIFAAIQTELKELKSEVISNRAFSEALQDNVRIELQEFRAQVDEKPRGINSDDVDSNGSLKNRDSETKNLLQSMVKMQTEMFGFFSKSKDKNRKSRLSIGERGKALNNLFEGADYRSNDSEDEVIGIPVTEETESDDDVVFSRGVRRGSLIKEANGFVRSGEVNHIIVTKAPSSTNHIVLPYLSVRTVLQFMRAVNRYQAREGISLKAAGIIEEGVVQNILSKNSWIRGDREFYNLSNDKLFLALQRAIRPEDVQGFLVALEQNVTFGKPGDEPPSWNKFKKLAETLDVYRLEFVEAFNLLVLGTDFKKELKYNGKDGSVDRIFVKGIPGVYARNLLRGGRHEFNNLKDFLDYFFDKFEAHRKLAKKSYQTARTYFTDSKKLESDDRATGRRKFRKLNNLGSTLRVDDTKSEDEDFECVEIVGTDTDPPIQVDAPTDYFTGTSEDEGVVASAEDDDGPPDKSRRSLNAMVPTRPSGKFELLRRPANLKPGGTPTIQVCFSFATKGECKFTREGKTCTYSHDPARVTEFLEETLKQATLRLKELRK